MNRRAPGLSPVTIIGTRVTGLVLFIIGSAVQATALFGGDRRYATICTGWALMTAGILLALTMSHALCSLIETRVETEYDLRRIQDEHHRQRLARGVTAEVLPLQRRAQ